MNTEPPTTEPPAPLAPSVEKAYYRKCIALKRRLNEVESANDSAKLRRLRLDRAIMKMRLERAFLLDELRRRMEVNVDGSEGSGEEGVMTPPVKERPLRDKRRGGNGRVGSGSGGGGAGQGQYARGNGGGGGVEEVGSAAVVPPTTESSMEQFHSEQQAQQQQQYAQGQTPTQPMQHESPYGAPPPPPPNGLPSGVRSERVNSMEMGSAPPAQNVVGNGEDAAAATARRVVSSSVESAERDQNSGERGAFTAANQ